ncbi:MAG: ATP-binding protein [Pseudomonadota bacterium]
MLGQAVENVIRNAMRFTPEGKTVEVTLLTFDEEYRIHICDQGPGVEPAYLEKIFMPFFRLDAARSSSSSSFGLGLALAKRQISAAGGEIMADNMETGGLRMSISLPRRC